MSDVFRQAATSLADPSVKVANLSGSLLGLLPASGVSVSALGDLLAPRTLSATDTQAVRIDELQFDLGEGPCWDAVATDLPVVASNLSERTDGRWPAFSKAIAGEDVACLFAFPIRFGPLRLGAVDVYSRVPVSPSPRDLRQMNGLMTIVGRRVLEHALEEAVHANDDLEPSPGDRFSRRAIHQATGVVLAQLDLTPEDAHLLIQGQAFATHRSMAEVADDLLERRIRFRHTETGITVEEGPDE